MAETTLKAVLDAVNAMEDRIGTKLDDCKKEIANNRVAVVDSEGRMKGQLGVVKQRVEDHIAWEEKRYAQEEKKHEVLNGEIGEIKKCVGNLKVTTAENKIKVGLLSVLGGSGAFGVIHAIKSLFSTTPPPQ